MAATAVFLIEACIAAFVRDGFVRPYLGDCLAVVLVYLTIRAATRLSILPSTMLALGVACAVEFGQYVELVRLLGLDDIPTVRVILGTGFDPMDFIAYAAGAATVLVGEACLPVLSRA
jgi:hypothetical protein